MGGKVVLALPLACPKDCLYKEVPFNPGNPGGPPEVGVTDMGCEVITEVKVVEPCCEAAAWSREANCSGLYSVLKGLDPESVTADMLGKSEDTEVACGFEDERTSTRL